MLFAPASAQAQPSITNITVGSNPWGVTIDANTQTAYVSNYTSGTVSVIKEAACSPSASSCAGTVTQTIPVGGGPQGLAVDPLTDKVYVANFISDNVTVINAGANPVTTSTITLPAGANLNPNSRHPRPIWRRCRRRPSRSPRSRAPTAWWKSTGTTQSFKPSTSVPTRECSTSTRTPTT